MTLIFSAALLLSSLAQTPSTNLSTTAERSGFVRTGRYAEVVTLCQAFAEKYPQQVKCEQFGTTPEGRPMLALLASADGTFDALEAHKRSRPIVYFQAEFTPAKSKARSGFNS